ncbi:hypothetical protein CVT25_014428 [Psilocybe cyanescens]|uniref:Uncharacterized protein n=1 Tax=Psilocybe cyanescens TaxID=93625 RepID=A0A409WR92_PSICY|nr:hypothetical protein CVT25_014428 [Psilocybe cyanescens]
MNNQQHEEGEDRDGKDNKEHDSEEEDEEDDYDDDDDEDARSISTDSAQDEEALTRAESGEDGHGHGHGHFVEGGQRAWGTWACGGDAVGDGGDRGDRTRRREDLGVERPRTPEPSTLGMGDRARRASVSSPLTQRRVWSHEGEDGESESNVEAEAKHHEQHFLDPDHEDQGKSRRREGRAAAHKIHDGDDNHVLEQEATKLVKRRRADGGVGAAACARAGYDSRVGAQAPLGQIQRVQCSRA